MRKRLDNQFRSERYKMTVKESGSQHRWFKNSNKIKEQLCSIKTKFKINDKK